MPLAVRAGTTVGQRRGGDGWRGGTGEAPEKGAAGGHVALLQVHQSQPPRQEGALRTAQVPRMQIECRPHPRALRVAPLQRLRRAHDHRPG